MQDDRLIPEKRPINPHAVSTGMEVNKIQKKLTGSTSLPNGQKLSAKPLSAIGKISDLNRACQRDTSPAHQGCKYIFTVLFTASPDRPPSPVRFKDGKANCKAGKELATCTSSDNAQRQIPHLIFVPHASPRL